MKRTYAAAAIIALLTAATPALGDVIVRDGRPMDVPYREVRYGDLNLDSAKGMDTLNRRLLTAVKEVCGDIDMRNLPAYLQMRDCRDASSERAFAARDALMAARLAARDHPDRLAAMDASLAVTAHRAR